MRFNALVELNNRKRNGFCEISEQGVELFDANNNLLSAMKINWGYISISSWDDVCTKLWLFKKPVTGIKIADNSGGAVSFWYEGDTASLFKHIESLKQQNKNDQNIPEKVPSSYNGLSNDQQIALYEMNTGKNIHLYGEGGTGKSYVLKVFLEGLSGYQLEHLIH